MTDAETGDFLDLAPVRFEFASTTGDEYDDNWLVIRGEARRGDLTWGFEDPALLVAEAGVLADWLEAISGDAVRPGQSTPEFFEPALAFHLAGSDASTATIDVVLSAEAAPPTARSDAAPVTVRLTVDRQELARSAGELRLELSAFPAR